MLIQLKKFGTLLSSRPSGKEAFLAFQPTLKTLKEKERIDIDFKGVLILGPSWADEFLTPMFSRYKNRIKLRNTNNQSVKATLGLLESIRKNKFNKFINSNAS